MRGDFADIDSRKSHLLMNTRPLLIPGFPHILHGGDYNPDQWLSFPDVIDEDFRLMALSGCNTFSIGIFAWTSYEKSEGAFDFSWLDRVMDRMAERRNRVILATPSGAKPAWLADKYPETRRVNREGLRQPIAGRHNHCLTSPVYRSKVADINSRLAERYAKHPALGMWHLSNEYSGECYCELCLTSFRNWLKKRYTTIDALNEAWWTSFWSHTFSSFEQIDPRDGSIDSLKLDFKRFVSHITVDFMKTELLAVRRYSQAPATTNLMGLHDGINYADLVKNLDLVADDQYPSYSPFSQTLEKDVLATSFKSDLHRCFKPDRPWMVMESCPDAVQWRRPAPLKRAEIHQAEMLQALGHGAEGTCYFQWRKGRAGSEKLHGAVVDHVGHEDTRVFRSVARLGSHYMGLTEILGSHTESEVALLYDWEVRWAFDASEGVRSSHDGWAVGPAPSDAYASTCMAHYATFARHGVSVDVVDSRRDLSGYKLVIAPQLWMLLPGVAERIAHFVREGGTFVGTYYTGYCDQNNRCFLGGFPGDGLMDVFGVWNEEVDWLPPEHTRKVRPRPEVSSFPFQAEYLASEVFALVHLRGATPLLEYAEDFYAGTPALTENRFGKGTAFYQAARLGGDLLEDFYSTLIERLDLHRALGRALPPGVAVQRRIKDSWEYLFLQNFSEKKHDLTLPEGPLFNLLDQSNVQAQLELAPWASTILRRKRALSEEF
jgi:beta-galactosidase